MVKRTHKPEVAMKTRPMSADELQLRFFPGGGEEEPPVTQGGEASK